jgi:hypothetical protein
MEAPKQSPITNVLSNLKLKKSYIFLGITILLLLVLILLFCFVATSPLILLGFVSYRFFNLINSMHKRNKNYKFDIINLEN